MANKKGEWYEIFIDKGYDGTEIIKICNTVKEVEKYIRKYKKKHKDAVVYYDKWKLKKDGNVSKI